MLKLYFECPKTRKWFSTLFGDTLDVPKGKPLKGRFTVCCRYCKSSHCYDGSEARRSLPRLH